ncbi:hypothetical protein QUF75_00320 [Desulfococcaceae bacterium HSG7]|nr:hypothetical protein [Desulfococcaceae bacterium HSG7]
MKSYAKFSILIIVFLAVLSVCSVVFRTVKYPALLTKQNQWRVEDKFIINGDYKSEKSKTDKNDLLRVMQQIKGIVLWGSWTESGDFGTGRLISTTFTAPPIIGVFVAGYPRNHKNELYIEQIKTGERITFPGSNPGDIWTAITLRLPPQWQQTQIRIVAVDNATASYGWLGVSSPFQITWRYHLERHKHYFFLMIKMLPLYLCSLFFFIIPGLFVSLQLSARRIYNYSFSLLMAFGFSALCGYLLFWVYLLNSDLGKASSAIYMLSAVYICIYPRTRQTICKTLTESDISRPLGICTIVGLFYLAVLYIYHTGDLHTIATSRFLIMPPDNIIPYLFSERLFAGNDPRLILDSWLSSDRPPLQTSIVLSQRLLGSLFDDKQLHYQTIATISQCAWIPAVWSLSRNLKQSFFKIAVIFTFLIFSGFFLFNSVYVWPKLLTGAFVIGTFILLLGRPQGDPAYGDIRIILASALAALGVLSHGGGIFTLIAIALVLLWPSCFPGMRRIILGCVTFIIFLTPWLAYQKFYEPPGNRLVKWHIAGVNSIDDRNVIQTLKDSYSQLNWCKYLRNKQENFKTLMSDNFLSWPRFDRKNIDQRKSEEFLFTLNALGVLNSGWLVLILAFIKLMFRKKNKHVLNFALKTVFPVTGIAILIWELLMFIPKSTFIHQGSYATMILLFCGLAILVTELPRWLIYVLLFYHIFNFGILWVYPYSPLMNYCMIMTACVGLAALLYFLYVLSNAGGAIDWQNENSIH